jgi:CRISPR/Cas system endoribonuclease Cas6 (RAMP superfamily)
MAVYDLPVARFQFIFQALTNLQFPSYAGSTWRGAFGLALRKTVCITRQTDCGQCLLQAACLYSQLFATPTKSDSLIQQSNAAPHPYIIQPMQTSGQRYTAGDTFALQFSLLGSAIQHLPYIIHSFQNMGQTGLGKGNGQYTLLTVQQAVQQADWQTIYSPTQALNLLPVSSPLIPALPQNPITLQLQTPLRLQQANQLVRPSRFTFQIFISTLLRRLSLLQDYYGTRSSPTLDYKQLVQQAETVELRQAALHWYDWTRYSNRQQQYIQMGGLIGQFSLEAAAIRPFWESLWLGQWLHNGKGTVMGLGQYCLLENP